MYPDECDRTEARACRRSMGREGKFVKQLETVQMTVAIRKFWDAQVRRAIQEQNWESTHLGQT